MSFDLLIRSKKLGHHEHLSPDKRLKKNAYTVDTAQRMEKAANRHIGYPGATFP